MKTYFCFASALWCACCFFSIKARGQSTVDSGDVQIAVARVRAVYDKAIGPQSSLYNGPAYYGYNTVTLKGSPYFLENTTAFGDVSYEGVQYHHLQLTYDLYKDELITVFYGNFPRFVLLKDGVQSFDLLGHHFVNINADTLSSNNTLKGGYYDELYSGHIQVLTSTAVTVKNVTSSTGAPEAFSTFTLPNQNYFLKKGGVYYPVASEGDALTILKDHKKQLEAFIKVNSIKYRKDPGTALAKLAAYYDSLSN